MKEADLCRAIVEALNQIPGVWCWRQNTGVRGGVRFGKKGQGDITGHVLGKRLELEVKLPHNKHFEPDQLSFIQRMSDAGCVAAVVRSVDDATALVTGHILTARGGKSGSDV